MVNKKGKGAKTKGSKPPVKRHQQETIKDLAQQSPQERVALVRPLWETLEQDERVRLLSVELGSVRARAKQLAEAARQQAVADAPEGEPLDPALLELEPSIEDVLEEGIKRLKEKGTWKLWQWPPDNAALYDAESFRQHITEKHIREELRRLLPRDEGRATEKPAEAAFRQRMLDLLAKVQQSTSTNGLRPTVVGVSGEDGATRPYRRRGDPGSHLRDANIELLAVLLEALAKENDHLYHSLLTPITSYVMEILPEGHRETTKLELSFEDLENLMPDDVPRIVEWLTEKVDALSTKLKPEPKEDEEEEEENMGDVDLWALTEDDSSLTVNAKWLQHLQDRLLGEDGHPRRAKPGEDPGRNGLVLEWVYGSIVSTAEKARDGSKRCLGMQPPTAGDAHMVLIRALEEHLSWETRAKQCKDLLSEMLKSRLEAAELTKQGYDLRPQPKRDLSGVGGGELGQASASPLLLDDGGAAALGGGAGVDSKPLPDEVILFMLRREALLTRAKLHFLVFEHLTQEKELRILKQALRQGEPEFERLKRELDEVKHQPRGMDGAYRSAAEMERHRHQLEVQTAFREQGARLQATYDKKQKAEYEMTKRETEIKQLQGWKGTVENLVDKFQELINSRNERQQAAGAGAEGAGSKELQEAEGDLEAASGLLTPQQHLQLTKMRNHFSKDVRKQLYSEADDRTFFDNLKSALKAIERRLEDSSVALQHLEMQLINVACDDPGAIIGTQLALPLLQDRLDQRGLEHAAQRAKLAEVEVLRMELLAAEREAAERERKKAAKAKKNEKVKSEKERLAAEKQAKEEAERAARQEAERERAIRDEEERRKRIEAVEAMRKAEEVAMELRRKELLSDENGYWRQRMMMEERLSGMGMGSVSAGNVNRGASAAVAPSPDPVDEADRNGSPPEVDQHTAEDDQGFIIESRRRRHKDTRDQDDEVALSVAPSGGSGRSAQLRSGSRDRMGPRDGAQQRERGDRDREPRRHQASASAGAGHRSGSREAGGRQLQGADAGQQVHRPPSAPPAAAALVVSGSPAMAAAVAPAGQGSGAVTAPTQATAAATPPQTTAATPEEKPAVSVTAPPAIKMAEPVAPLAFEPTAVGPATSSPSQETNEVPAAPASASPEVTIATSCQADVAEAGPAVVALAATAVPKDAILFGGIAVIPTATVTTTASVATPPKPARQLAIPVPIPVATLMYAPTPSDSQLATAPPQPDQQLQPYRQQEPAGKAGAQRVASASLSSQQPEPSQPGPSSGMAAPHAPQQGQGAHVQPMGPMSGESMPGPMPSMLPGPPPPPMLAHMAPGPGQRPPVPAPGPPPPYMHVNGAIPVPLPAPGGPMGPMPPVLPKQMQGHPIPGPPPQGAIMMPMGGPPGARPPMPGPGMTPGQPPGMAGAPPQPGIPVAAPPQPQPGAAMRQTGPMGQQGPIPGVPGPQGGIVPVPHPQGPGQPPHGQAPVVPPPGAAARGASGPQGQPMIMPQMQFGPPMHGGAMGIPHGQPSSGPMGHVPPGMYVFPPGGPPGMLPPGAPAQLPPHPHMLHVMPGGVAMPMGVPPPLHMQPSPPQQQQQGQLEQQPQGPPAPTAGPQPQPSPKSPTASAAATGTSSKLGSTLNANARSFVPSGKAASAAPASISSIGQQQQPAASGQQHGQGHRQQYHRQSSGNTSDASSAAVSQMPPPGPQQPAFQRGSPAAGPHGGQGPHPGQAGGQYGSRRDRREQQRSTGGAGGRKGAAVAAPPAGHGGVLAQQAPGEMLSCPPAHIPAHPHAPPHPMAWMGAPMVMGVGGHAGPMQVPMPLPHGPGMEAESQLNQVHGLHSVGPLDRPMHDVPSNSKEEGVRPPTGEGAATGPQGGAIVGIPPAHPVPPPSPGVGPPGAGPAPGPGHSHGMQHHMMPPPHGIAPPHAHGASRVMLVMPPGMPGPITVSMHMPVIPMMPVHMMPPGPGAPAPGPNDGPVQKNGSAAESVRAPQHAQQPETATAGAEAGSEGARCGMDSAAAASATAPMTRATIGDNPAAAASDSEVRQEPDCSAADDTAGAASEAAAATASDGGAAAAEGTATASDGGAAAAEGTATASDGGAAAAEGTATASDGGPAAAEGIETASEAAAPVTQAAAAPAAVPQLPATQSAADGEQREMPPPPAYQQQPQQQRSVAPGAAAGGVAPRNASVAPSAPMSWSSVAAARRESNGATSPSGYTQDAFPSLVAAASSPASSASTPVGDHPPPAASSSWKAKLQQNVSQSSSQQAGSGSGAQKSPSQAHPAANGGGSPAVVRGSSLRGTSNGSVQQLVSSLSDSAIAHVNGVGGAAVPLRLEGNRPSGSALLSAPTRPLPGSLSLSSASTCVEYLAAADCQPRQLHLVRGLQNLGGQHNCFLNVTIQSLWHLRSFRQAVLQLNVDAVAARGAAAADLTVLRALVGVFRAMAAQPVALKEATAAAAATPSWVVSPLELREALSALETGQSAVRLDLSEMHDAFEVLLVLLTCLHRAEAGSGASQGQDPQLPRRVRVRDIAAGRCSDGAGRGTSMGASAGTASAGTHTVGAHALANGQGHHQPHPQVSAHAAPTGYAAALAGGAAAQHQRNGGKQGDAGAAPVVDATAVPSTAAHTLFGLEVQAPCAAEDDDASSSGSSKDRQHQQGPLRNNRDSTGGMVATASPADVVGAAAAAASASTGSSSLSQLPSHGGTAAGRHANRAAAGDEVEVYTKFFHLVHAQALRKAFAALGGSDSGVFFEDVLCVAEASGSSSSPLLALPNGGPRRSASASSAGAPLHGGRANGHGQTNGHGWVPGATAAAHPLATLLRFPSVFTIALVWESPKAPMDALRGTLEALGPRLDMALLFRCSGARTADGSGSPTQPRPAPCELRSVICYFGHHYLVFALSEELGLWLLIDDDNIKLVGHWGDVAKAMCAKRLQPSLLFYEALAPSQGGAAPVVASA